NAKHPYRDEKSLFCCGVADTVKTKFKVEPGDERYPEDRWYAWIKDEWLEIPPEKIVQDYAPNGQAYLFMLSDTVQCFVRPKGGLSGGITTDAPRYTNQRDTIREDIMRNSRTCFSRFLI